jgi:hypothetical protein
MAVVRHRSQCPFTRTGHVPSIVITAAVNEDKPKVSGAAARQCLVPLQPADVFRQQQLACSGSIEFRRLTDIGKEQKQAIWSGRFRRVIDPKQTFWNARWELSDSL